MSSEEKKKKPMPWTLCPGKPP